MADTKNIIKTVGAAVSKHAPELLTAFGIANMFTGVVLAVRATPKALDILGKAEEEKGGELSKTEIIADTWKVYIPAAAFCLVSVVCFIGSNAVNKNRCAALTAAYTLSETAFREYKDEVREVVGEQKEQEIHTKTVQKKIDRDPVSPEKISEGEALILPDGERTLCYDAFAGRYFYSDRVKIDKAVNELNHDILTDDFASLNDFYDLVGLERTKMGDMLGWSARGGLFTVNARYSSHLAANGQPCLAVSFNVAPKYEYN